MHLSIFSAGKSKHIVDGCEILHHQKDAWNPINGGMFTSSLNWGFPPPHDEGVHLTSAAGPALSLSVLANTTRVDAW